MFNSTGDVLLAGVENEGSVMFKNAVVTIIDTHNKGAVGLFGEGIYAWYGGINYGRIVGAVKEATLFIRSNKGSINLEAGQVNITLGDNTGTITLAAAVKGTLTIKGVEGSSDCSRYNGKSEPAYFGEDVVFTCIMKATSTTASTTSDTMTPTTNTGTTTTTSSSTTTTTSSSSSTTTTATISTITTTTTPATTAVTTPTSTSSSFCFAGKGKCNAQDATSGATSVANRFPFSYTAYPGMGSTVTSVDECRAVCTALPKVVAFDFGAYSTNECNCRFATRSDRDAAPKPDGDGWVLFGGKNSCIDCEPMKGDGNDAGTGDGNGCYVVSDGPSASNCVSTTTPGACTSSALGVNCACDPRNDQCDSISGA
jgi:hypothetical protein